MTGLVETHRSFVNTWECDENDHLNVQFYLKRFDEAARFFGAERLGLPTDAALPRTRHVRYHAELRGASTTRVRSGVLADGRFAGFVVHVLENLETGTLAATALDSPPAADGARVARITEAEAERALPRGVAAEPAEPISGADMVERGALIANRSIAQPAECDAAGELNEQFYVSRFTDAAPHIWDRGGVSTAWLRANNFGRVALEMKITHHRPARAGDGLMLYGLPSSFAGKTFRLRHEIKRLADGAPLVTGEVVAVVLDLASRRTVALPQTAGSAVPAQ